MKKRYLVTDLAPLEHDKKRYGAGEEVEMEESQAQPLLQSGVLVPVNEKEVEELQKEKLSEFQVGSTEPTDSVNQGVITSKTRMEREEELKTMYDDKGWKALKAIAEKLGISKAPDGGWDAAIPLILDAEGYGENNSNNEL